MTVFSVFIKALVETVFPEECVSCGVRGAYCCRACLARPVPDTRTLDSGRLPVLSGYPYADPLIRRLVHDFKYLGSDAARGCVDGLAHRWMIGSAHLVPEDAVLVPVPMHPSRWAVRGRNQAEILARMLGGLLDLPVRTDVLFRVRGGASQTKAEDRERNVAGAFRARAGLRGEAVLVDDVVTSGSTMRACASALAASGARCRLGLALAHGTVKGTGRLR